jgi:hypothetical protein
MIWSRVRQVNELRSLLREYCPAALAAFGTILADRGRAGRTRSRTLTRAGQAAVSGPDRNPANARPDGNATSPRRRPPYYDRHRAGGATHSQALHAVANRLVGILHACLRDHILYDETAAGTPRKARSPPPLDERAASHSGVPHGRPASPARSRGQPTTTNLRLSVQGLTAASTGTRSNSEDPPSHPPHSPGKPGHDHRLTCPVVVGCLVRGTFRLPLSVSLRACAAVVPSTGSSQGPAVVGASVVRLRVEVRRDGSLTLHLVHQPRPAWFCSWMSSAAK